MWGYSMWGLEPDVGDRSCSLPVLGHLRNHRRGDAALRKMTEQRTSRLLLADLLSMDLDLDEDTMRSAWRPTGQV